MKSILNKTISVLVLVVTSTLILFGQGGPIGWASFGAGTTGGEGGDTVIVTNRSELQQALSGTEPRIVMFEDTIHMTLYERMDIGSNKTLLGMGYNAVIFEGGFEVKGDNVILQNMAIGGSYDGDWSGETNSTDAITIYGVNVWVDHCDLFASADGLLDIRADNGSAANFVTVSNTRFSNHNKVMLIGSSNSEIEDRGKLKTTILNCWFDGTIERGLHQRMPRTRFGDLHIFNNYFEDIESYCSAARFESDLVIEANYYRTSNDPHFRDDVGLGIEDPEIRAFDNFYELTSGRKESVGDAFNPGTFYDYTALPAEEVPAIVLNSAGRFNPPGNLAPIANPDTLVPEGSGLKVIDVIANDTDPDGGTLRVARTIYSGPAVTFVRDNTVLYAVPPQPPAIDTIQYELVDTQGGVDTGMVVVVFETSSVRNLISTADLFEVRPNPVNDLASVTIEGVATDFKATDIRVVNLNGQIMQNVLVDSTIAQNANVIQFQLSTSHLAPGMYTIVVGDSNRMYTQQFVVVH